jgi:GNAT superfamily N-acetyltransferase
VIHIEQPCPEDIDVLHPLLRESYWSPGVPRETVERACAHSVCAIARDEQGDLIGFGRAVTDRTVFAWVCDVIVVPAFRGKGIGRGLVDALRRHPEMQGIRRWMLGTRDAHEVYATLGFGPVARPDRLMEILVPAAYLKQQA